MKANFRIVALPLAAMALTVACKNAPTEEVADTMPAIDTTVIDSVVEEDTPDTVVVEKVVVKNAPAKQKSKVEQVVEDVNTVKKATLETKKDVQEVVGELKKGEGNSTKTTTMAPAKKNAAEAFKKN